MWLNCRILEEFQQIQESPAVSVDYANHQGEYKMQLGGWKPHTYYVVRIAVSPTNVIHDAILHVGFLGPSDSPLAGNYTSIMVDSGGNGETDYPTPEFLHYLEFKSVIEGMTEN